MMNANITFSALRPVHRSRSLIPKIEPLFPHSCEPIPAKRAESPIRIRGGLAPWQIREVTTYIESHLDTTIRTKDLAVLVRRSSFQFCRAFRKSFNDSPHGYLMRRRVERAQGLRLMTNAPLGQIAADCGLVDQAHFNKLFRRFVGDSPGAWRRARATAPAQSQAVAGNCCPSNAGTHRTPSNVR